VTAFSKFATTIQQGRGKGYLRTQEVEHLNLEAFNAILFRVKSKKGIEFRKWANKHIRSIQQTGVAVDAEKLNEGAVSILQAIDPWRIENQKYTPGTLQCWVDLLAGRKDQGANLCAMLQNMIHFAVHGHTAAEIIKKRCNPNEDNCGFQHWKNKDKGYPPTEKDISGVNFLTPNESRDYGYMLEGLRRHGEILKLRGDKLTFAALIAEVGKYLEFYGKPVLSGLGKVSHEAAEKHAKTALGLWKAWEGIRKRKVA
jgi:hypothetical protein